MLLLVVQQKPDPNRMLVFPATGELYIVVNAQLASSRTGARPNSPATYPNLLTILFVHQVWRSTHRWNAGRRTAVRTHVAVRTGSSIAVRRVWPVCPSPCPTTPPSCKWFISFRLPPFDFALCITNPNPKPKPLWFLQPPRAELHYGTAAQIVLQLSTTATHRPVQQQHIPDCPRCPKRPKAVNHSVSR